MSTVWWSLPSLHGSILPQGCQQFTITSWFNSTPRMSRIWWYNLPSHWLSTVQCSTDVNKTVIFTMTWMLTTWWYLPWQESQQHCNIYHDMMSTVLWYLPWYDVNSAVIFTMIWCQQCCDIYHDMDLNSTVVFTMMKMSTVLWYLNWHGCQQYCGIYHDEDVNSTVVFKLTWMSTVL